MDYKKQVEEITKRELTQIRSKIRTYLESATLSLIGLEKRYNDNDDYEIDHCNGRNSVLIDAFREIAIDEAKKIAKNYKLDKSEIDLYKKAFKDEVKRNFDYAIQDLAKVKAKQVAEQAFEKIKIDVDSLLSEEMKNASKDIKF